MDCSVVQSQPEGLLIQWNISDIPSELLYVPKDQFNYYLRKSLWLNELLRNFLSAYIKKPWISAWIFVNLLFTWRIEL